MDTGRRRLRARLAAIAGDAGPWALATLALVALLAWRGPDLAAWLAQGLLATVMNVVVLFAVAIGLVRAVREARIGLPARAQEVIYGHPIALAIAVAGMYLLAGLVVLAARA
ncbi:hypothetical protein EV659_106164 [Rhodothalassium salexigens DSM 2132]|uniref:Uncharacterized protein n=1 Tax=Rhodothalassium salexigens DSM 2132 TaxID=1188247 RepID=A0A4R2PHA1_RHOSA|nr:hypothetical protein [Rhodothalassium salexigens]MBB4211698.1 hypothetical protein [Rhodothalassium salexigens DSM 2132]MBK1638981.1 hypothetical protein [Rhodothalassium salexigens DSM 2132]TCP34004.1 hypothetical protein EV659_106164 [Rhodothalassium salexigens DSM 2132]